VQALEDVLREDRLFVVVATYLVGACGEGGHKVHRQSNQQVLGSVRHPDIFRQFLLNELGDSGYRGLGLRSYLLAATRRSPDAGSRLVKAYLRPTKRRPLPGRRRVQQARLISWQLEHSAWLLSFSLVR